MWKAVYDSVAGYSHLRSDIPCQDACRVVVEDDDSGGLLIVVCADGAGSAELANVGSTIASDEFVKLVQTSYTGQHWLASLDRDTIIDWLHRIRITIEQRAEELNTTSRQLATTLLVALVGKDVAVFTQIGDGAMIVRGDKEFRCVFWPQSGEYANTTNFLTDDKFEDHIEFERTSTRVNECVAFTDGLERLILRFEDQSVHRPFIEPMLSQMRQADTTDNFFEPLRSFLNSDVINERTDDDKTLVLATRLNDDEPVC